MRRVTSAVLAARSSKPPTPTELAKDLRWTNYTDARIELTDLVIPLSGAIIIDAILKHREREQSATCN